MKAPQISKIRVQNKSTGKIITLQKSNFPANPYPAPRGTTKIAKVPAPFIIKGPKV